MTLELQEKNRKSIFSILWVFAVLNYLYCDVLTLMDSELLNQILTGGVDGLVMDRTMLFFAGILMEIPMAAALLSKILPYRGSRLITIIAGIIMTLVQISSLFVGGGPTGYYIFFSIVEAGTTLTLVLLAFRWKPERS